MQFPRPKEEELYRQPCPQGLLEASGNRERSLSEPSPANDFERNPSHGTSRSLVPCDALLKENRTFSYGTSVDADVEVVPAGSEAGVSMEVAIGSAMELWCHSPESQAGETGSPLVPRCGQALREAACKPARSYCKFHLVGTFSRPLCAARRKGNDGKSSVQREISKQTLARSITWHPRPCWPRSP